VRLELVGDLLELPIDLGQVLAHLADLLRRADPGHDVLTLRVGQVLAVERLLAGVRIAGERDAGARVVAHVPEDHRHDVHGGAEVMRDPVELAVVVRTLSEPGVEDGAHGELELPVRIGRELVPGLVLDDLREPVADVAQLLGGQIGVELRSDVMLQRIERLVEIFSPEVEHDPPEHRDEAPPGVPREALVAGQRDESLDRLGIEAEVENGVHHPGHAERGAGADRHEERVLRISEALVRLLLELLHVGHDVVP
jgi:hypothetical protein